MKYKLKEKNSNDENFNNEKKLLSEIIDDPTQPKASDNKSGWL